MVHLRSSSGKETDVSLDFDAICAYEEAHPEWTLFDELAGMEKRPRMTTLNLLASFFYKGGWLQFARDGYNLADLRRVMMDGLKELGFTSAEESPED